MVRIEKILTETTGTLPPAKMEMLRLPFDLRQKSRQQAQFDSGETVQLFLPHGTRLKDGDLLETTDGRVAVVKATPERVLVVTADSTIGLARLAYHLGNRHTPVELGEGYLRLEYDSVLEEMLRGLGGKVEERSEPFEPEQGAYGGGHQHDIDEKGKRERAQEVFHGRDS